MGRVLGIEFAPLHVPIKRRLETLAAIHYVLLFLVVPVVCLCLPVYLCVYTSYWWLVALYGVWLAADYNSPRRGSHPWPAFRRAAVWTHLRDYFPAALVKTADLHPGRNYIFGCHPHGVMSLAAFVNFGTDATGFSRAFPGIQSHLLTLSGQFWTPLRREYMQLLGICDCTRQSMSYLLSGRTRGHAAVLVVGGATEALDAHPGCFRVNVGRRRGFVRLALEHGAHLVPVYSFGENDLFEQADNPDGSTLRAVQMWLKDLLGFSPPAFHGRGVFNYNFGLLPFRRPMHTVVGAPLSVKQVDAPTAEQVDELHARYVLALKQLFDAHKASYGIHANVHLAVY